MKLDLKAIKAVAFDLDGTIYLGEKVIDGAINLVTFFSESNIRILYFTNSSMQTRGQTFSKLVNLGVPVDSIDAVLTSAYASALYLKNQNIKYCYCIGHQGLLDELAEHGISNDELKAQAILIGLDHNFSYDKLAKALKIITKNECKIIACNLDKNYPTENGTLMPACGAIVAAIEVAADKKANYVTGKPNIFMMELISKRYNLRPDEILVIGDNFESDIMMANNFKSPSILIAKTGLQNNHDTIVVQDIQSIKNLF